MTASYSTVLGDQERLPLGGWRAPSPFQINFATKNMKSYKEEATFTLPTKTVTGSFSGDFDKRISHLSSGSSPSDPGMIEDSMGWSDSDVSFDDTHSCTSVRSSMNESHPVASQIGVYQHHAMSSFASKSKPTGLRQAEHRRGSPLLPGKQRSNTARATAPVAPKSQRPTGYRSHSFTSPSQRTQVIQPSRLSNCTTADSQDSSAISFGTAIPVFPDSVPITSTSANEPLMELMEKSVFEDDDEDDDRTGFAALASRLRLSSPNRKKKEGREFKRSASETMRDVFGFRK